MKTDNTFNTLITETFTKINDEVFCSLVDIGIDAGQAYRISYIDVPMEEAFDSLPPIESLNLLEDFDDVTLIDL